MREDDLRLVRSDDSRPVVVRPLQPVRSVRKSDAPPRLLLKVESGMSQGYTFIGLANHIGVPVARLRDLIKERFERSAEFSTEQRMYARRCSS